VLFLLVGSLPEWGGWLSTRFQQVGFCISIISVGDECLEVAACCRFVPLMPHTHFGASQCPSHRFLRGSQVVGESLGFGVG